MNGLPRLYVYKVESGSATILLNVQLAGDQANQPFTTFKIGRASGRERV